MRANGVRHRTPIGVYLAALIVVLIFVLPVLWVFSLSVRPESDLLKMSLLPGGFHWENYRRAMTQGSLTRLMMNSAFLGVLTSVIVLPLGFLAGYSFARFRFWGRRTLLFLFMFSLTIPGLVNLIGVYKVFTVLHVTNNQIALAVVYAAGSLPMSTWMSRAYVLSIPRQVEEAAWIDGCTAFGAIRRIVAPLSGPSLASVGIVVFVGVWQEFIVAQTLITSNSKGVVSQGLFRMQQQYTSDNTGLAAGSIIISVVPVLLFVLLQRRFVSGMTMGARTS